MWLEANDTQQFWLSNAGGYPIVYTAPLHPASAVSLSDDAALVEAGWATVAAVANVSAWRPGNGLCMAWPPAARVAGRARAAGVLDGWAAALAATMGANFWPDLDGGGIEQFGATEALNSALLQSQEGFVRLFPMWPPGENASFVTLRARGALLVSARWGAGVGVLPPVTVALADPPASPRAVSLLDPWSEGTPGPDWPPPVVTAAGGGGGVPVSRDPAWPALPVWTFVGQPGAAYDVAPGAAPAASASAG